MTSLIGKASRPFGPSDLWHRDPVGMLVVLLAIAMPIVSAILFPTYMHQMPHPSWEWARLLEMPFVVLEIAVVLLANRRGMNVAAVWRGLPGDMKIAVALLLVGLMVSSALWSQKPAASLLMSIITVFHLLFAAAVFHLLREASPRSLAHFLGYHAIGLVLLALYTAWWFSFAPDPSTVMGGEIEWFNALPGFISARQFGAWTGAIAAGFTVLILFEKRNRTLDWRHAAYFLAVGMSVWSGTRAAVLAIALAVVIFVIIRRELPTLAAIGRAAILGGAATTLAWLLLPDSPAFYLYYAGDLESLESAGAGRIELWALTWNRWLDSPLFGWGTGSTFWEVSIGWAHTQPHNVVLQFLISWGAIGAAGGLWIIGRALRAIPRAAFFDPRIAGLTAMLIALLLQSLVEGMLHYPRFIVSIIVLFAILIECGRRAAHGIDKPGEPA